MQPTHINLKVGESIALTYGGPTTIWIRNLGAESLHVAWSQGSTGDEARSTDLVPLACGFFTGNDIHVSTGHASGKVEFAAK